MASIHDTWVVSDSSFLESMTQDAHWHAACSCGWESEGERSALDAEQRASEHREDEKAK